LPIRASMSSISGLNPLPHKKKGSIKRIPTKKIQGTEA